MSLSKLSYHAAFLGLLFTTGVFAQPTTSNHTTVLILGAGMSGIIAARTLYEQGINDFVIIDAKTELGGRMIGHDFGVTDRQVVVEMGPSWIQGTQQGDGAANPIWELALKYNLTTVNSDWSSMTTYDDSGYNNFTDVLNDAVDNFNQVTALAGQRLSDDRVDASLSTAYGILGVSPKTPQEVASEYYQIDFPPSQTSWLASARKHNFTYVPESGGFSDVHQMSTDQRGFSYIVQAEAAEFLQPQQLFLNQTVNLVEYGNDGVTVQTTGGMTITADYVLSTFSAGVLQNTDVVFKPSFPDWKVDAIHSIDMAPYTKIYLQFNDTFWFPTEMGLYAAKQRGKYAVWQNLDHPKFFPGSGIILATVTGDWALYVEQLTANQVQSEVLEVLQTMYPNITIPEPAAIRLATWASNKLYRGSFSNWGSSYVPGHSQNLKATLKNRLWFAGEATSVEYFGLLQGAYFEGQSAGKALATCIQGNSSGCNAFPSTPIPKAAQPYPSASTSGVLTSSS